MDSDKRSGLAYYVVFIAFMPVKQPMEGSGSTGTLDHTLLAVDLKVFESGDTKLRFESVSESIEMFTYQYYRTVMLKYTPVASS